MSEQVGNASTEETKVILYGADSPQRVAFLTEFEGESYEIAYLVGPVKDELLKELELRRNLRVMEAEPDEANQRGVVQQSDDLKASAWYFEQVALGVEGVGESDDELPEDWMSHFSNKEKADVIDDAVLAYQVVQLPIAKSGKRLPWKHREGTTTTRLRAIFNGYEIETEHVLDIADAETLSEFTSLMARGVLVQGTKINQGETYIPGRLGKLGAMYQRLKISAKGYAGRVPLHHQAAVVIHQLGKQSKALTKK